MNIPQNSEAQRIYWNIFNKIKQEVEIASSRNITYVINLNLKRAKRQIPLKDERVLLQLFLKEKLITETKDFDEVQVGESLTQKYVAMERHYFSVNKKFDRYYNVLSNVVSTEPKEPIIKFQSNGEVTYISNSKIFKAHFNKETNSYKLLTFLIRHPNEPISFDLFDKVLKKPRLGSEDADIGRRVRDTIQTIRETLKLSKDEMIKVKSGVILTCNVHIET